MSDRVDDALRIRWLEDELGARFGNRRSRRSARVCATRSVTEVCTTRTSGR